MTRSRLLTMLFALIVLAGFTRGSLAHYDPGAGRWLQRDPIGYDAGQSLFAYASSRPIDRLDPEGTKEGPVDGGYGATRCDPFDPDFKGKPITTDLNELCVGECIKNHEKKRREQLSKCCSLVYKCMKKYSQSDCIRAYARWLDANRRALDCEAQRKTAECITKKVNEKKCCTDKPTASKACCQELLEQEKRVRLQVLANCLNPPPTSTPCPFDNNGAPK